MTITLPESSSPNLFSMFSSESEGSYRVKREAFAASLLGQGLVVALLIWLTVFRMPNPPIGSRMSHDLKDILPVVFSGSGGGGGGSRDVLRASHGAPPKASLEMQLAPPIVVPNESPKLPVPATVMVAPEVPLSQGNQIGDPTSKVLAWLSNGTNGHGGIGNHGCCGVGSDNGTGVGPGPGGVYTGGIDGVSIPRVIYNPEPSFSEEARRTKNKDSGHRATGTRRRRRRTSSKHSRAE